MRLAPPRSAEAEAREWEIAVLARSRAHGTEVRSTPATLEIAPYSELEASISPERRSARIEATFDLSLTNRANAPVDVELAGVDAEGSMEFAFREPWVPPQKRKRDPLDQAQRAYQRAEGAGVGRVNPEQMAKQAFDRATAGAEGKVIRWLKRRKKVGRGIRGAVRIAPGETVAATVGVSPPKQIWIGRSVQHPFQVTTRPAGADAPGPSVAGTLRQKPWLPWWLLIVIPLIVLAVIWFLSSRTSEAAVPDLSKSEDVFAAKSVLEEAGFTLGETFEEESPNAKPGTIIEQTPAAGETAAEGTAVSVKVATGAEKKAVPDLTGQTADQAKAALTAAGFTLGRPLNEAADPASAKIANQIPVPDSLEATGAAIDVVFAETAVTGTTPTAPATAPVTPPPVPGGAPPPATTPTAPAGAPATPGTPAPAGAPVPIPEPTGTPAPQASPPTPGGGVSVPALTGRSQAEAADALAGLGLVPGVLSAVSPDAPAGSVVAQDPAGGTEVAPGATVTITISRGYPAVIHDQNGDIVRVGGATGEPVQPLAASDQIEEQASASFATPLIAYRRGKEGSTPGVAPNGQIWVLDPADPRSARPLTDEGFDDRRPAISPDGKVVAFVSNRGRPHRRLRPLLRRHRRHPGGAALRRRPRPQHQPARLVAGRAVHPGDREPGHPDRARAAHLHRPVVGEPVGLGRPGPRDGRDAQGPQDRPGAVVRVLARRHAASPSRRTGTATPSPSGWSRWRTASSATQAQQQPFIAACELAWRPDGGELAITQRNSTCDERGRIVRVSPASPNDQTLISRLDDASGNPVWAPPAAG